MRSPTSWFINVDLPTFGLPTMFTKPDLCIYSENDKKTHRICLCDAFVIEWFRLLPLSQLQPYLCNIHMLGILCDIHRIHHNLDKLPMLELRLRHEFFFYVLLFLIVFVLDVPYSYTFYDLRMILLSTLLLIKRANGCQLLKFCHHCLITLSVFVDKFHRQT